MPNIPYTEMMIGHVLFGANHIITTSASCCLSYWTDLMGFIVFLLGLMSPWGLWAPCKSRIMLLGFQYMHWEPTVMILSSPYIYLEPRVLIVGSQFMS